MGEGTVQYSGGKGKILKFDGNSKVGGWVGGWVKALEC